MKPTRPRAVISKFETELCCIGKTPPCRPPVKPVWLSVALGGLVALENSRIGLPLELAQRLRRPRRRRRLGLLPSEGRRSRHPGEEQGCPALRRPDSRRRKSRITHGSPLRPIDSCQLHELGRAGGVDEPLNFRHRLAGPQVQKKVGVARKSQSARSAAPFPAKTSKTSRRSIRLLAQLHAGRDKGVAARHETAPLRRFERDLARPPRPARLEQRERLLAARDDGDL